MSLSPEEEEALRQMQAVTYAADLRAEDDPNWFANGAQIELFGLESEKAKVLNGQFAEVVGFNDNSRRYRVRLLSDSTIKVVARKNMKMLEAGDRWDAAQAEKARQAEVAIEQPLAVIPPESVPSRTAVQGAIDKVHRASITLRRLCEARKHEQGQPRVELSDLFLELNVNADTCEEALKIYNTTHPGDEELNKLGTQVLENYELVVNEYMSCRTWAEFAKDEWNNTRYSVQKHGLIGTLKNEVVEVGKDVAGLGEEAAAAVSVGAEHAPRLVRSATSRLGGVVSQGSQVAASATASVVSRGHERARNHVHEQVVTPVKRAWHLLVMGFFLCFILPLFALRTYAPLNTVVSNLGIVYCAWTICCPPRCARHRAARAGLLVLWPLVTVVFPLWLHFWLTHPGMGGVGGSPSFPRQPPRQLTQLWNRAVGPSETEASAETEAPAFLARTSMQVGRIKTTSFEGPVALGFVHHASSGVDRRGLRRGSLRGPRNARRISRHGDVNIEHRLPHRAAELEM